MDDDYGIVEPRNEADEFYVDTWYCYFCDDDIAMHVADGDELPDRCPRCGRPWLTPDVP